MRIICQRKTAGKIIGNFVTQLGKSGVGGVIRFALLQRADTCFTDVPRGDEVRLTDRQRNGIRHFGEQIKEFADSGRLDLLDAFGKNGFIIHHRAQIPLSSTGLRW